MSVKFIPKNTKKNTNWSVKNFTEWRDYHNSISEDQCPENLLEVPNPVLINKWIARFMAETRREDGSTYPPKTIAYNWHLQSDKLLRTDHIQWCIRSGAVISNKPRVCRPCCQGNGRQKMKSKMHTYIQHIITQCVPCTHCANMVTHFLL